MSYQKLASYKRFQAHLHKSWPTFQARRAERLRQHGRYGDASERVAENIVEDLMTIALDWQVGDISNQVDYADMLLTRLGIKYCVIETKRPGALAWNQTAVQQALSQARRYADEQNVRCIAVSDGHMLYAANIESGGLTDRVLVSLDMREPPLDLWWLSEHGIYRPRVTQKNEPPCLLPAQSTEKPIDEGTECLLHPKYCLPSECFAYVGNASKTSTWKLPYLLADGSVDVKRLPKAIQSILSNYRGARVSSVPESFIPDVLKRLSIAAERLGRMPIQDPDAADVYVMLAEALKQIEDG
ncbi:MAG: hypothetical protein ACXVI1_05610 [Halobacteriota archaeon]